MGPLPLPRPKPRPRPPLLILLPGQCFAMFPSYTNLTNPTFSVAVFTVEVNVPSVGVVA